ncbi:MAG: methylenetetrahydrofolate reductase [Thermodesulfobacteriota bacterium]|nr:methylenetetrahydrofolate reductase [Thermodesulfobacteriota bacterium]
MTGECVTESRLEKILKAGHFAVTGECGPPRGADAEAIRRKCALLKDKADAFNITDNQTSVVRMSSIASSIIMMQEGMEPIMQMVCRDRNRIAMQSDILGAAALGVKNMLCLSGDHQRFGDHPQAKNVFDIDSIQLLSMVRKMRDEGKFLGGDEIKSPPKLFVGAAANPFADPFEIRAPRLAKKIAAGAEFVQTQCIFNLKKFSEWMKQVVDRGLHEKVFILGGVTPFKSFGMAKYMGNNVPGMDVPDDLLQRMKGTPKENQAEEGIKIAVETIQQLKEMKGISGVHIMAIEWEEKVGEIAQMAGLLPRPSL